ncbi:9878_t:CDS:2 [Racocetra fulgida]|uniref:9878_t:CDS:1 n=1 Tax=Racocetra fulgida TaxID=60492 RepID=A0A9N9GG17_9GLOM|nr:9878_t:CDS:2 [Racocetra fulgida]
MSLTSQTIAYGDKPTDYVESKESPSAAANLYQKAIESKPKKNSNKENQKKTSGTKWNEILLFGLQLQQIQNIREMNQINRSLKSYSLLSESGQRNRSKKGATMFYQAAQEQIKTIFHNDDIVILNEMNFTINSHSYSFVYNQLHSNTEELRLLAVVKAMDISKISQSAYRTIANFSQSLLCEWAVSEAKKQLMYNMTSQIKTVLFDLSTNLLNNSTELIDEEIHFNDQNIVESVIKSVRKGAYRSIKDILAYLIPTLVQNKILNLESRNIYLRISADGRNKNMKA